MKRIILMVGAVLILSITGSASTLCTSLSGQALTAFEGLGAMGCSIGDIIFSNFTYSYSISGSGTGGNVTDSNVTVNVIPGNLEFDFNGNWLVTNSQVASLMLTFTVSDPAGLIDVLQNANVPDTLSGAATRTIQALCTGGTCGPTDFTGTMVTITGTHGALLIKNSFTAHGNGPALPAPPLDQYHLSIITDQFQATPEPVSCSLLAGGLGALLLLRRRLAR